MGIDIVSVFNPPKEEVDCNFCNGDEPQINRKGLKLNSVPIAAENFKANHYLVRRHGIYGKENL